MTIAEIARLAGVSIGTVDRVLHNRGRVAPKTVETIMAIIDEYGYQPNAFARNLKLQKTYTIGVILPALHSELGYWRLIYNGVMKAVKELAQLSVSIELGEYDRLDPKTFLETVDRVMENKVDAILLAPLLPRTARVAFAFPDERLALGHGRPSSRWTPRASREPGARGPLRQALFPSIRLLPRGRGKGGIGLAVAASLEPSPRVEGQGHPNAAGGGSQGPALGSALWLSGAPMR